MTPGNLTPNNPKTKRGIEMRKTSKLLLLASSLTLVACTNTGRDATKQSVTDFKAAYAAEVEKPFSGLNIEGSFDFANLDDEHKVVNEVKVERLSAELTTSKLPREFTALFTGSALRAADIYVSGSATKFYAKAEDNFEATLDEVAVQAWAKTGDLFFDFTGAKLDNVLVNGEKLEEGGATKVYVPGFLNGLNFELDSSYIDEYGLAYAKVTEEAGWNYLNFSAHRDEIVALYIAPFVYTYTMGEAKQIPEDMRANAIAAYRQKVSAEAQHMFEEFDLEFKVGYNSSGLGPMSFKGHGKINIGYEATGEVNPMFPQFVFDVDIQAKHRNRDSMPQPAAEEFVRF